MNLIESNESNESNEKEIAIRSAKLPGEEVVTRCQLPEIFEYFSLSPFLSISLYFLSFSLN